jgi:hypothetical protein
MTEHEIKAELRGLETAREALRRAKGRHSSWQANSMALEISEALEDAERFCRMRLRVAENQNQLAFEMLARHVPPEA